MINDEKGSCKPVFSRLNTGHRCGKINGSMNKYMKEALAQAKMAEELGEVPIGAVIVRDGEIIARGHNLTVTSKDPTAHAEMIAIRQAAEVLGGWRLTGCDMYVTIEPCSMCAGAIVWSRINRLVIGAMDPKAGACGSVFNIVEDKRLNHMVQLETGIMEAECSELVKHFFAELRSANISKRRKL